MPERAQPFSSLTLNLEWSSEPSAHDLSSLLLSLQTAYEILSDVSDSPPTLLQVSALKHPNMLLTITGVTAAIIGLKSWLAANPAVVLSVLTLANTIAGRAKDKDKSATEKAPIVVVVQSYADALAVTGKHLGDPQNVEVMRQQVVAGAARELPQPRRELPFKLRAWSYEEGAGRKSSQKVVARDEGESAAGAP